MRYAAWVMAIVFCCVAWRISAAQDSDQTVTGASGASSGLPEWSTRDGKKFRGSFEYSALNPSTGLWEYEFRDEQGSWFTVSQGELSELDIARIRQQQKKADAIARTEQWPSSASPSASDVSNEFLLTLSSGRQITRSEMDKRNEAMHAKGSAIVIERMSELDLEGRAQFSQDLQIAAAVMPGLALAFKDNNERMIVEIMHKVTSTGGAQSIRRVLNSTGLGSRLYEVAGNKALTGSELWEQAALRLVKSMNK